MKQKKLPDVPFRSEQRINVFATERTGAHLLCDNHIENFAANLLSFRKKCMYALLMCLWCCMYSKGENIHASAKAIRSHRRKFGAKAWRMLSRAGDTIINCTRT